MRVFEHFTVYIEQPAFISIISKKFIVFFDLLTSWQLSLSLHLYAYPSQCTYFCNMCVCVAFCVSKMIWAVVVFYVVEQHGSIIVIYLFVMGSIWSFNNKYLLMQKTNLKCYEDIDGIFDKEIGTIFLKFLQIPVYIVSILLIVIYIAFFFCQNKMIFKVQFKKMVRQTNLFAFCQCSWKVSVRYVCI